jgi:multiple sugar transport system permease protein/sn-glycerol 3-phosphate transport system permease protein
MRSNLVVPVVEVERARRARPARRRSLLRRSLSRLLLIVICASVAFPFFWIAVNSLQPLSLVLATPPHFWPAQPQWHNYADAWHAEPFGQFYVNSIVVSTAIIVGQVITCALAAYALSWVDLPFKGVLFFLILVALMVPEQLIVVPVFLELHAVNWINSYQALIVPFLASAFGIFLLRQSFLRVPRALVEAARIDGASHLWVLLRVVAPLSLPGFITLIVLNFIWHYNDFFWPLIMTNSNQYRTLPVGLAMFVQSGEGLVPWNQLMAADIFSVIPLFVIFFVAQRYLVNGIVSSGLK